MTLTLSQAKESVALAIASLKQEGNAATLKQIVEECQQDPNPMVQFQLKMTKLIPKVTSILGEDIAKVTGTKVEQNQVMGFVSQIQQLAATDLPLSVQVGKIVKTLSGDFSGLYEEDSGEELEEIE